MAEPDQSGAPFLAVNGPRAASDNASTDFWSLSHLSELFDTATTRLPSALATASNTVLGDGLVDCSRVLAHVVGFVFVPKLSRYSKRTETPYSFFVFVIMSVTLVAFSPSRLFGSVMSALKVAPDEASDEDEEEEDDDVDGLGMDASSASAHIGSAATAKTQNTAASVASARCLHMAVCCGCRLLTTFAVRT